MNYWYYTDTRTMLEKWNDIVNSPYIWEMDYIRFWEF